MLTFLNTNCRFGTYSEDRNNLVKRRENDVLADPSRIQASKRQQAIQDQLRPHFDKKNSLAIGYGLDLLTNSVATINGFLVRAGRQPLSQHDVGLIITAKEQKKVS